MAPAFSAAAQVIISEFMASNTRTLADENGDYSDWIELQNLGSRSVNLEGWSLTDTRDDLAKWQFPAVSLPPGGFLVVFASGKDRSIAQLHTNFRLANTGEYLALVQPDQVTIAWEFAAPFPPHAPDISFGIPLGQNLVPLVRTGGVAAVLVPANDSLMDSWIQPDFDATAWPNATTPIGYQTTGTQFTGHLRTDITTAMRSLNATVYSRQTFAVADPTLFEFLTLRLQYDDGFVAYLNGFEIARRNAPEPSTWNSGATAARSDAAAVQFGEIDISSHRSRLQVGLNCLAIQGINRSADDSDFLLGAELLATAAAPDLSTRRYFAPATPGAPNGAGNTNIGPLLLEVEHTPSLPFDADDLQVRALLQPTFDPVQSVVLTYRVMYGAEASTPMFDDGQHADGAAGDGVYGASIPASRSLPGQMVRYFITATDAKGARTRHPLYSDPRNSPQYEGTMVLDPKVTSALPVLYWFAQNAALANSTSGTRGSLFFEGEFYDNINANVHGQSTSGSDFPKKSYDFDLNRGHKLRYATGQPRVDDFNLLTTYADKAHLRNVLSYDVYRDAGSPYHFAFPVRVQTNGVFFSLAHFVENGDDNYLERLGLDPQGALYKMYNTLNSSTSGVEKKTRKRENNADLQALIAGTLRTGAPRAQYLYDNVNLPEVINFLAAMIVTAGVDCCHKNYYLYRDTEGTGEWEMHPWDVDLTFGRNWNESRRYFDDTIFTNNSLFVGGNNLLPAAIFGTPPLRQSYLRRVRTLLDQLLQPATTPAAELKFERQIDHWFTRIAPDAALDFAKWPTWGQRQTLTQAVNILRNEYLPGRRAYVYSRLAELPAAQPASPSLRFGAMEINPVSRNQQQEFFSLTNPNNYAVDLAGWRIDGAVQYTFRPGAVLPALGTVYLSPNVKAFRARPASPRGGEGLFVQGNYSGQLSARGETLRLLDGTREVARTNWPAQASLAQQYLRVTEFMYRPRDETPTPGRSAEDFEFIELKNTGPVALDMAGVHFAEGIEFTFPAGAQLAPGAYALLVHNAVAFSSRYGNSLLVLGEFIGNLDNNGEKLRLEDAGGERILEFNYDPATHGITDGLGFSLVITNETLTWAEWETSDHWRPGDRLDGSPGAFGRAGPSPPVMINELLAHSILPAVDAVELHNPSAFPVDVSGWYLTDDRLTPKKFRLPPNTLLAGGGYRVITEFTSPPAGASGFSLSSAGDEIYLYSADSAGNLTGYVDGFAFGPSPPMVTFGRHHTSVGSISFPRQAVPSLGRANTGPQLGPVIINEIYPAPGNEPFVELRNLTTNTVNLWDAAAATGWKLNGLDFVFPPEARIAPLGLALVVSIDPVWFRSQYHIANNVPIFGPYPGTLQVDGERLELAQPTPATGAPAEVRFLEIDALRYENRQPWPAAAAGLERQVPAGYAPDPASWRAPPAGPSPGIANNQNRPPAVQANDHVVQAALFPFRVFLTSNITDDGQSTAPASSGIRWEQTAGPVPALLSTPAETNTWVTVPGAGVYRFRISTSDGQLSASDDLVLVVYGESLTAWKVRYFSPAERANLAISSDNADPDGDKLTNLQEYIAGTNPRDPLSYLRIEALSDSPDGTRLQFSAASGKSFVLEYRESLTSGTWQFLSEFPLEPVARTVDFLDTSTGSSQRFYRLVTRAQP